MFKKIIISVFIFITIETLYYLFLRTSFIKVKADYLKAQNSFVKESVQELYRRNEAFSDMFCKQAVCTEKNLKLLSGISNSDKIRQKQIRNSLYSELINSYKVILKYNYRQLHFHLPDNTSFLRFHRPENSAIIYLILDRR